ncbi:MAG TPA: class I SAM-dependent methyltransferase, partial [Actinomycetota bacterium]|nr:class I SAM-dependent methyltransferase [Actinomycetota bacterium]
EGGFASGVVDAIDGAFASAVVYRLVERVPDVHARQRDKLAAAARLEHSASVADVPRIAAGCVFANEVLDNLPVHLVEATPDGLAEVMVTATDGALELVRQPPSNPELARFVERTGTRPAIGQRVEVTLAAESLIAHVGRRLEKGAVFFVDYGAEGAALGARGGSLLSYSERGITEEVLERPGEQDITAHANWTSVMQALARAGFDAHPPMTQRDVLLELGARDLDAALKHSHRDALARADGKSAVAALSRRQALRALLDAGGLGGLEVVAAYKRAAPIEVQREETGP